MKTSINIFNRLTRNEVVNLTQEVKETIADVSKHKTLKSFSTADLWDIQRRKKVTSIRRYSL